MTAATSTQQQAGLLTILGGTTVPEHAAIVRESCREGGRIALRRGSESESGKASHIEAWLECPAIGGLLKQWKRIGHLPEDAAAALTLDGEESTLGYGTVISVIVPVDRLEAAVTVRLGPWA